MARIGDNLHAGGPAAQADQKTVLSAHSGETLKIPDDFISHADILRDGQDLVLKTADGHTVVIQGYFSADPHPAIHSPSGAMLSAEMIQSFVHHIGPVELADNATANDASPVGVAREVHGHATIRHTDGTTETIAVGTPIHEGDVVETEGGGAVNITFRDNSSFAVSQNAKLAIDEYVFDPHSDAGTSNFSMLRGVFVYTSGLIGHADPDDVHIHTPAGSIGIRGTVIAGNVDTGTVTVVEGAITLQSNSGEETTLSSQYQTAQLDNSGHITAQGNMSASDVAAKFSSVSNVAPAFFSGLGTAAPDAAHPEGNGSGHETAPATGTGTTPAHSDAPAASHGADAAPAGSTTTTATASFSGESAGFGSSSGDAFGGSPSTSAPSTTSGVSAPAAASAAPAGGTTAPAPAGTTTAPDVGTTAPQTSTNAPAGGTTTPTDHQPTGAVTFTGGLNEDHILTAANNLSDSDGGIAGTVAYTWQHSSDSGVTWTTVGTGATYMLTAGDVGDKIRVTGSYTDGAGNNDSASSAVSVGTVLHTDHQPTGSVTFTGALAEDSVLTAANNLSDPDGGIAGAVTYTWQHSSDSGVTWNNLNTGATHTLTSGDVNDFIRVTASYTDGDGTTDTAISAVSSGAVTHTNHLPTGIPVIDASGVALAGTPVAGQLLTADASPVSDADGINTSTIAYQWQHNGNNISGATGASYTVNTGDAGETLSVVVSYTDNAGAHESVASAASHVVNTPHGGTLNITGAAVEGQVLAANSAITDADGVGTLTYQWQDNGVNIAGATASTYTLGVANLGHTVDVIATYTDGGGTVEHVTSAATGTVVPPGGLGVTTNTPTAVNEGSFVALQGSLISSEAGLPASDVRYTLTSAVGANGMLYYSAAGDGTVTSNLSAASSTFTQAQIDAHQIYYSAGNQSAGTGYAPETPISFTVDDSLASGTSVTSTQTFYALTALNVTDSSNIITGGNHGDTITLSTTGAHTDVVNAGTGADTFFITTSAGGDTINGNAGDDIFNLSSTATGNIVDGDAGNNTFHVSGSNFTIYGDNLANTDAGVNTFTIDGTGNTVFTGQNGDTVYINGDNNHVVLGGADTINIAAAANTGIQLTHNGVGVVTVNLAAGWSGVIDGTNNVFDGTEVVNTATGATGVHLGIDVDAQLTAATLLNTVTINLRSAGDALNLDFGANSLGYHEVFVSATETEYIGGSNTIVVNHVAGASIADEMVSLSLNSLLTASSAQGFSIIDNNDTGFGSSIASLDINGDGMGDLAVVQNADTSPGGQYFEALNISGSNLTAGITTNAGFLNTSTVTGMQIAAIGDFNGNGTQDFIIGAPEADSNGLPLSGNVRIIDGSGNTLETFSGVGMNLDNTGVSVAGIGDINHDGYADVLVGASDAGGNSSGGAYILYGGPIGALTNLNIDTGDANIVNYASTSQVMGYHIPGSTGFTFLGADVGSAGDFNNDGVNDFMVSAPGNGTSLGEVYIYSGAGSSLITTINMDSATPLDANPVPSALQTRDIPLVDLGDVNGGGVSDIGVLSYADNKFYGFFGGSSTPTLNVHTPTDVSFTIAPTTGQILTAGAVGDFNGDGFNDIGVVVKTGNTADIYVVYGGDIAPHTVLTTADLNNANVAYHMTFDMTNVHVNPMTNVYDMTIGSAGDINGDGFSDVAIGVPGLDTNGGSPSNDGAAFVVYGQNAGNNAIVTDNSALDTNGTAHTIVGGASNESLVGTSGADTLGMANSSYTGVSYSAGAGDDTININSSPFQKIDGGSGFDTIHMLGGGSLDFSNLGSQSITRIEQIDMSGTGQNVTLSMANIFNIMETSDNNGTLALSSSGSSTNTLTIKTGTAAVINTVADLDAALHTTAGATINGGQTDFHFGSHILAIDTVLITSHHVTVV